MRGKRMAHRFLYGGEHAVPPAKAHFRLGGMRVHIHIGVIKRYVHHRNREAALFQEAVIRLLQRISQHSALHPAAVHEEAHIAAIRPIEVRPARHSRNRYGHAAIVGGRNVQHRLCHIHLVHRRNRIAQTAAAGRCDRRAPRV